MSDLDVDVVLFDLGGVLFDFRGVDAMKALTAIDDDDELWRRWLGCPWVRSFERGQCSADDFAAGVVSEWSLAIEPQEFLHSFRSWATGPFDGAEELVRETRSAVRVGVLSNTNALHWDERRWPVLEAFDVRFLSFRMGLVKPDRETFDRVAEELDVSPGNVLFLDDNAINVDAAAAVGFNARRAVGVEDARTHLTALGVL